MIELRGVSRTVMSGTSPLTILHPLDFFVPAGQSVAVTGPSGSGKSTLLGLIAGLDAPTSGSVLIDGVDITRLDEDRLARLRGEKIGVVFQFFQGNLLVDRDAVVEYMQIAFAKIDDFLPLGILYVCVFDVPLFRYGPIKHRRAARYFTGF